MRVTDFLHWQAELVRECAGRGQFITTDYGGMMKRDVNEEAIAAVARHSWRTTSTTARRITIDGAAQSIQGDFTRSLKHGNFLVTETNAQTTDWTSAFQYPPYDGQLREDVYTHIVQRRQHGGVLALGFDRGQPGDVLEGRSVARSGAEPRRMRR